MSGAAQAKRSDRVGERIRAELMEMISRGAFRDPGLTSCYVTEVKLTNDLRHARVYVRSLLTEVSESDRENVIAGLGRASAYIRRELAPRLKLKYHPELKFFWDDNVDRARRVEELLHEIEKEAP